MKKGGKKERISIEIDKNLLNWIGEQIKNGQFDSRSAGIRKCILIAKRVYENATTEEMVKFIIGQKSRDDGEESS